MKVNFFMMEFIGFVSTFATLLVFTVANDHENISISPTTPEVVHYINDSHIALCNFPEGTKAQWISPKGMLITKTKGRVHIEEKASGKLALVFEHTALEDKGEWTCAQIDGEGQKSFKMVINQPITFVDTSTLQIAKEGADAVIRCEVKGDPEPAVSWSFNGEAIFLTGSRYTKLADGLSIKKVSRNDSGEYTCRAFQVSENMNNMDQRVILLKIKHKPEGRPKSIQYGFINGVVNLTCEALAEPQAHFKWSRPEKKIKDLSKFYPVHVGNHSSSLQVTISNATLFGTYKCNASNGIGWIEKTITLQEGTKPDPPKDFHLRGKTSEMFDVSVNAVRTSDVPNEMEINGFVFEAIPEQEYKSAGGRWDKARRWNFAFNSEATLLINNLAANTTYLVRIATKNLAGLSDWTKEKLFTTKPKELPMPTFSHQIRPAPLDLTVILSIVAVSSYLNFAARQTERSLNVFSRIL